MAWLRPNRQITEAAAWRLACELCRRHPELRLIEPHPGVAGEDCLALVRPDSIGLMPAIVLDREGGIDLWRFDSGTHIAMPDFWAQYVCGDPKAAVEHVEAAAGLPRPATMPASTETLLALRVLAAIAASAVFGIREVRIRAGLTQMGPAAGLRAGYFAAVPGAAARLGEPNSGHGVWFVVVDDAPRLAVDALTGTVWRPGAPARHLMQLYRALDRRLAPVLTRTAEGVLA